MLSVHPNVFADTSTSSVVSRLVRGWETPGSALAADHMRTTGRERLDTANPLIVGKLIREYCWSPILWGEGHRRAANFACALWVVLAFECSAFTARECAAEVTAAGLAHVVAMTRDTCVVRTHEPPHENFLLLLRAKVPIGFSDVYRAFLSSAQKTWPGSLVSTARDAFFSPVWSVVSAADGFAFSPELDVEG